MCRKKLKAFRVSFSFSLLLCHQIAPMVLTTPKYAPKNPIQSFIKETSVLSIKESPEKNIKGTKMIRDNMRNNSLVILFSNKQR